MKLNRNNVVVYGALLISLGYLVFLAASIHEGIYYAGDQALKSMQVQQIAAGHGFKYLYLGQPEWVQSIWAKGYFPLRPPFFYPSPNGNLIVYPPLFQIITSFFYAKLGWTGLYVIPMVCTLILLGWTASLLKRCGVSPANIALAILLLVFCSPLALYGVMFWEHLPAVLLLFAGLSFIAAPPARTSTATFLGVLTSLSIWLRPEALMMVILYSVAVVVLFFRDRKPVHIAFGIGIALVILPWLVFNQWEYGSLFGIHGQQVLLDNDPDSRMSLRNGFRNLRAINDISIRHFWFLLLLFPILYRGIRRKAARKTKAAELRPLLLASVVILYSVLTPFMLPNDGVIQWGPRYFLAIIPVTILVLFMAQRPAWLTVLILIAALPSFYQNTHGGGIKELRWRYNNRLTSTYNLLNQRPGNVVIATPHFMSYDFGYIFDQNFFFGLTGDDSLRRLLPLLKSQGVHQIICLYSPRFHTLPPMLEDSATRHQFDAEAASGWIKEDIASKVFDLDSLLTK